MEENIWRSPEPVVEDGALTSSEMEVWAYAKELRLVANGLGWMLIELVAWTVYWTAVVMVLWLGKIIGAGELLILLIAVIFIGAVGTWYCAYFPRAVHKHVRGQIYLGWLLFFLAMTSGSEISFLFFLSLGCSTMLAYLWMVAGKVGNMRDRKLAETMVGTFWVCFALVFGSELYLEFTGTGIPRGWIKTWLTTPWGMAAVGVMVVGMVILYAVVLAGVRKRILDGLEKPEHEDM